ncbi:HET-domain-containing protein, partial [Ophiobolus disseminans]
EIRLLQLHPSYDPSSGIECTLETYFLSIAPPYKALSYAWNEDNQSQTVIVSKSLAHALRRLRNPYVPVLLWLDSLCINQMDDDERTSQVGMMGMIYQSAAEVIIWLG